MKKKGILAIAMIPRFLFLAIALFSVYFLTKYFIVQNLESNVLEMEVFYNRLIYSPNTLSYVDEITGRAYPGIIDLDKLTADNLNKTLNYTYKRTIAAKIQLNDELIYYNEKWYKRFAPLRRMGGLSGVIAMNYNMPVTYEDEGDFYPGILKIEILKQKT